MRLFVALAIPAGVRQRLGDLIRLLRDADASLRWVAPQNLHVTLKFIGEVPAEQSTRIGDALESIACAPFDFEVRGLGFFPNARRPSVLWVGITQVEQISKLAAEIDRVLAKVGTVPDTRPFSPHLTLGRFKLTRVSATLAKAIDQEKDRGLGRIAVNEFHLIESRLKSGGPEYTTLRSFPLG